MKSFGSLRINIVLTCLFLIMSFLPLLNSNPASASFHGFLFGYSNYDECIVDKMKAVDGNNKVLQRSIIKLCRSKFPQKNETPVKKVKKWLEMSISNARCQYYADLPNICNLILNIENLHNSHVSNFRVEVYRKWSNENCRNGKTFVGEYYEGFIFNIGPHESYYDMHFGEFKHNPDEKFCFKVFGEFYQTE